MRRIGFSLISTILIIGGVAVANAQEAYPGWFSKGDRGRYTLGYFTEPESEADVIWLECKPKSGIIQVTALIDASNTQENDPTWLVLETGKFKRRYAGRTELGMGDFRNVTVQLLTSDPLFDDLRVGRSISVEGDGDRKVANFGPVEALTTFLSVCSSSVLNQIETAKQASTDQSWVDINLIEKSLSKLSESYSDVPSAITCGLPPEK